MSTPPDLDESSPQLPRPAARWRRVRLMAFIVLAAAVVTGWWLWGDELSVERLVGYKHRFDAALAERPLAVYAAAFAGYVAVTGLSLPLATVLTVLYASLFGFWPTVVLVSFASTAGATAAFLASRYLLRDAVQAAFGRYLGRINAEIERDGAFYLFTLRLTPVFPFFLVNLVLGLTPLKAGTFWWVSQLGMLPGTCMYAYAGATIDLERLADEGLQALFNWPMVVALVILGVAPLALKKFVERARLNREEKRD
jgi:uncharacterized membrane protein YdjX (TVP38/TMEM64 family)